MDLRHEAGLGVERELGVLELLRVFLAEQLAHELAQLLRIEAVAGDQRVEIGGELRGRLVAIGDVARERLEADRIELGRDAAVEVRRRRHLGLADLLHQRELGVAAEQLLRRQHLVEDDAGGEHVGARVERHAADLLRATCS